MSGTPTVLRRLISAVASFSLLTAIFIGAALPAAAGATCDDSDDDLVVTLAANQSATITFVTGGANVTGCTNPVLFDDDLTVTGSTGAETVTFVLDPAIALRAGGDKIIVDLAGGTSDKVIITGTTADDTIGCYTFDDCDNVEIQSIDGKGGDDTLVPIQGNDTLVGGSGVDTVDYRDVSDSNYADGKDPYDVSKISETVLGLKLSLATTSTQSTGISGTDSVSGVENIKGTEKADTLTGSADDNEILGEDGDDTINGGDGRDVLVGGDLGETDGDTVSYAGASSGVTVDLGETDRQDTGGADKDTISGFENLTGSSFDDFLIDDPGADNTINGGANGVGGDTVSFENAAAGIDVSVTCKTGCDDGDGGDAILTAIENVIGSDDDDEITGNSDANVLRGGAGNDIIDGGKGDDTLVGGKDGDIDSDEDNYDKLTGGDGVDTVSYDDATYPEATSKKGVTVALSNLKAQNTGGAGWDRFVKGDIENVVGTTFNDTLGGTTTANVIDGGLGSDTISYAASAAGVTIVLDGTTLGVGGSAVGDKLANMENVTGSAYSDTITGNAGANTLIGGAGNDVLTGGAENDTLTGGADSDVLDGGAGSDAIAGGDGIDQVSFASATAGVTVTLGTTIVASGTDAVGDTYTGIEGVTGSAFADRLTGDGNANTINGGAGNDVIVGGGGDDVLDGGVGTDTLSYAGTVGGVRVNLLTGVVSGAAGVDSITGFENVTGTGSADVLTGNSGSNILLGGGGGDTLNGGAGADTLNGGGGNDRLFGGGGADKLVGGLGDDLLNGGPDTDTCLGGLGKTTLQYCP